MNNSDAFSLLDECQTDLNMAQAIVSSLGLTSHVVPYLTKYAIIKACGTIEVAYKTIIADHCSRQAKKQVKTFIDNKVRDSSRNPTFSNICALLQDFDSEWSDKFKRGVQAHADSSEMMTSLKSLVDARNDFAHGGNPTVTISDVIRYFNHCRTVVTILDSVVT